VFVCDFSRLSDCDRKEEKINNYGSSHCTGGWWMSYTCMYIHIYTPVCTDNKTTTGCYINISYTWNTIYWYIYIYARRNLIIYVILKIVGWTTEANMYIFRIVLDFGEINGWFLWKFRMDCITFRIGRQVINTFKPWFDNCIARSHSNYPCVRR